MAKSKRRVASCVTLSSEEASERPVDATPADVIARGWISVLEQLDPCRIRVEDPHTALGLADHWTVEVLLKLAVAAPECAYEVGVRIVELTESVWILQNAAVSVFEPLVRRDPQQFQARLAADVARLPRLGTVLALATPVTLGRAKS
jgi:hypothetical protein